MPVTAHSDPYAIFMRKIGYSVGLEHTLERATELQELYVRKKDLTAASWANLVSGEEHWNLGSDNISDVFCALRLIQKTPGDIVILENLDAMAIADVMLDTKEAKLRARLFVLLWAILVNDGEIFVNLLLAGFSKPRIKTILSNMIEKKRLHLSNALPGRDSFKRICRVVNIDRQKNNKGSKGGLQSVRSLQRTEPLHTENRLATSKEPQSHTIEFSEEYFRKVPPRRKKWAGALNLWNDTQGLTKSGKKFIDTLEDAGYIDSTGFFMFFPMDYELKRAGFQPNLFGDSRNLWSCLTDFAKAFANLDIKKPSEKDPDKTFELLKGMMDTFRNLHVRKSMLRRELPITVAYPAAVALAVGQGASVIDLPAALIVEQTGEQRRISIRKSRHTGHALSVRG